MLKRILLIAGTGGILALLVIVIARRVAESQQVVLSDGRLFCIEAVTFGTNHVVGWNDWWLVPFRKILPNSAIQFLTPTRGQSRQTTDGPALVIWVHARAANGKYVDCQGVRVSLIDEQGDVYPANTAAHSAFENGFNREGHIFHVFPRRSAQLKLQLSPSRSLETSTVLIPNPCRQTQVSDWTPEPLPAARRIENLEFRFESLVLQTNGGPPRWWEPLSVHWQPVFNLNVGGRPETNWQAPDWEAQDTTGNRGKTLGLHEPLLKFIATTYPKPEAVNEPSRRWQLPVVRLPTAPQEIQWNTNRVLRDVSITVLGLFPPGAYTFTEGQLTKPPGSVSSMKGWSGLGKQVLPGKWRYWATHGATNYTAFLRWARDKTDKRIAVALTYQEGPISKTEWARSDAGGAVTAFVFDTLPGEARDVALEVVLLEPLHAEVVVRPPVERLSRP